MSLLTISCASAPGGESVSAPPAPTEDARASARLDAEPQTDGAPSAPEPRAPLGEREPHVLELEGHYPAPIFVPSGDSETPLRVVFIAHGAGGRGIDHCLFWSPQLPPDFVVVCPAGTPLDKRAPDGGSFFADHFKLRAELAALIEELKRTMGDRIRERKWRYMGYSQGATMGALAVVGEMPIFSELVLIEGGGENWNALRAQKFKERGGERVLLSCGTKGCAAHGRRSVAVLEKMGVEAFLVDRPGAGHTPAGEVGEATRERMMSWE